MSVVHLDYQQQLLSSVPRDEAATRLTEDELALHRGRVALYEAEHAAGDAGTAQARADEAWTLADAANDSAQAAIDDIALIVSDNVLSRVEKPAAKIAWDELYNEWDGNVQRADAFGVSHANYDTQLGELQTYLGGLSPAWDNFAVDTTIVGATYRAYWTDAYNARSALLQAIYTAAKGLADQAAADAGAAQDTADGKLDPNLGNLTAGLGGGGNLLPNSGFMFDRNADGLADSWNVYSSGAGAQPTPSLGSPGPVAASNYQRITWAYNNAGRKGLSSIGVMRPALNKGTWYTFSYYARASGTNIGQTMAMVGGNTPLSDIVAVLNPALTANWQRYVFKLRWNRDGYNHAAWQANTAYGAYTACKTDTDVLTTIGGGTTGATMPGEQVPGTSVVDGTVTWLVHPANELWFSIPYNSQTQGTLDFSMLQIEQGEVVTGWAPSPYDASVTALPPGSIPKDKSTSGQDFDNLWSNSTSEEDPPLGADVTGAAEFFGRMNIGAGAYAGSWVRGMTFYDTEGAGDYDTPTVKIPCVAGQAFHLEAQIKSENAAIAGKLRLRFRNGSGTSIQVTDSTPTSSGTWGLWATNATAPAGAVTVEASWVAQFSGAEMGTTASVYFDAFYFRRVLTPELIASQAVTLTPGTGWSLGSYLARKAGNMVHVTVVATAGAGAAWSNILTGPAAAVGGYYFGQVKDASPSQVLLGTFILGSDGVLSLDRCLTGATPPLFTAPVFTIGTNDQVVLSFSYAWI